MDMLPTPVALCAHKEITETSFARLTTTMKGELRVRQTNALIGTNTCGWIDGNPESSVTCPSSYGCGAISTFVGCTPDAVYTTCFDRLGPTCDQSCQNVLANLYCGNDYCAQFNYPSGSIGYGCATISGYTNTVLLTTTTAITSTLAGVGSSIPVTSTTLTTNPKSSSTSAAPLPSSKSLSSGAIAGIVIGSVATIVFICGLAFMIYAHRKKNRQPHDAISRESAMSLNPSSNAPSSQSHPHHLSGSTYYDNVSPPFNPGDGPWSTAPPQMRPASPKAPEELEANVPYEKDASEYDPRSSTRYSELSTRS